LASAVHLCALTWPVRVPGRGCRHSAGSVPRVRVDDQRRRGES
jgi:hypothetical protein